MHPMAILHTMSMNADTPKGISRDTVKRVWQFSKPYRPKMMAFVVLIIIGTAVGIVPTLAFRDIIDVAIAKRDGSRLNLVGVIVVIAALISALVSVADRWLSSVIGEGIIFDLRDKLFRHIQAMPLGFFTQTQTGALISRLNNDVVGAQSAFTSFLSSVVGNVISLVITLATMFFLEWRLTLLSLAILPFFLIPSRRVGAQVADISRESMQLNASMNTTMTERFNVAGALLVKLFGRPPVEAEQFSERAARVRDIGVRRSMYAQSFTVALTLVGALGTAAIYWIGGRLVINGSLSVGDLAALSLLVVKVYLPLTALTSARVNVTGALVSFERVFEMLDLANPIVDAPDALELRDVAGSLRFDDVTFAYPAPSASTIASLEERPNAAPQQNGAAASTNGEAAAVPSVLRHVNLSVEPGQLVAVVGPSGAGKSTLMNLVPRLYDVSEGALLVDGVDVRTVTQDSLRRHIGVVSQDPHMFHDTIGANLRYAKHGASDEELVAACRAARIMDVIDALPDRFDTLVGERGYRLSGGEKQRLAIARMLLKDPSIVILDEATSHLDSENEVLVQAALEEALKGRTSLVIAHRLSTITSADVIVVIDGGEIVEQGTHRELRALGGLYDSLYENLVRTERPHEPA